MGAVGARDTRLQAAQKRRLNQTGREVCKGWQEQEWHGERKQVWTVRAVGKGSKVRSRGHWSVGDVGGRRAWRVNNRWAGCLRLTSSLHGCRARQPRPSPGRVCHRCRCGHEGSSIAGSSRPAGCSHPGCRSASPPCSVELVVVLLIFLLLFRGPAGGAWRWRAASAPRVQLPRAGAHRCAALLSLSLRRRPAADANTGAGCGFLTCAQAGVSCQSVASTLARMARSKWSRDGSASAHLAAAAAASSSSSSSSNPKGFKSACVQAPFQLAAEHVQTWSRSMHLGRALCMRPSAHSASAEAAGVADAPGGRMEFRLLATCRPSSDSCAPRDSRPRSRMLCKKAGPRQPGWHGKSIVNSWGSDAHTGMAAPKLQTLRATSIEGGVSP